MLDAPVFGSTGPAKEGTLGILVGGEEAEFEGQRDVLSTMGKHLYYFGAQGSGALAKLCFNLMVAAQVVSLAEAMSLARKGGLELRQLAEALLVGPVSSALIEAKTAKIVKGDFSPAFPLKHMHKDLGLIVRTADALGAAVPASAAVHQLYTAARMRGHAEEDFSAVYKLLTELAGLE
jgi:3-hydroxyisobutyrate dehydrogenase-like beta-hydroxyacid dehydrogenase